MLYKRSKKPGAVWWVRFTINGEETRVSSGTNSKADAEEFEQALRAEAWREKSFGDVLYTWEDAKAQWLKDKADKRSLERDREAFAALDAKLANMPLADIDKAVVRACDEYLSSTPFVRRGQKGIRSRATIDRIMAALRGVLMRAVKEWEWIPSAPAISVAQSQPEPRWITQQQFDVLWRELPGHAQQIVTFMVAMGLRSGNVFGLRWDQVDTEANVVRLYGDELKGKKATAFPIPPDAATVLRQQRGAHPVYVFTDHRGRAPVGSIKTCWGKAAKRAGVPWMRPHDLRHTFAAWHKLAGTPDGALQALGGWSSPRMVRNYGHVTAENYSEFADNRRLKKRHSGTGSEGK